MSAQKPTNVLVGVMIAAVVLVSTAATAYWAGASRQGPATAAAERSVLYWYDPMHPDVHFERPGRSPYMAMDLVPRYADEAQAEAGVRISASVAQNLGVRLASVDRASLERSVLAAGVIAFNERTQAVIQSRAGGFVERTHARAVGDVVGAGAPIVDIRVPDWAAAQAEYLALRDVGGELAQAARRRLTMLGMPEALIERIERDGAPQPVFVVTAPVAGAITSLDVRSGMTIASGAPLATITALSPVWLIVSLPQADAALARPGGAVTANLPAYPGESFAGRIEAVLPSASVATRTVEVRISLSNPDARLRPGMTAEVRLSDTARPALVVPAEAVIRTGARSIVIVTDENGAFSPREVVLGRQEGDRIEIGEGLTEGERVVASGQFLIDSEANLSGVLARLNGTGALQSESALHRTTGRIVSINAQEATIAHAAVADLNWPAMTMQFRLARPEQARGLARNSAVAFGFREDGGVYVIEEIQVAEAAP